MLFSADFARLTLVAESFLLFLQVCLVFITFVPQLFVSIRRASPWIHLLPSIQPLSWQQPYVPVLSRTMLDFLMVPTALLMGCHVRHFKEVAAVSKQTYK